jgi:hypothetical protein
LLAVRDRGSLMGNRGILHDAENRIVRNWAHKSWVACLLAYKEIKRPKPFSPGNYSELFFLDEATAFAAGHRPCTYCQRKRSNEFKSAWLAVNVPVEQHREFSMKALDATLHGERAAKGGAKVTYEAEASALPNGAMFEHGGVAYLVNRGLFLPWSFQGYGKPAAIPSGTIVKVLTPRSIVAAFRNAFTPTVHASAAA